MYLLKNVAHFTVIRLERNIAHQNLGASLFLLCHLATTCAIILSSAKQEEKDQFWVWVLRRFCSLLEHTIAALELHYIAIDFG